MTWLSSNWGIIGSLTLSHLWIALPAIALSVLFSVPIARWAAFSRRGGWVLSALSALYAVPSLPLLIVIPVIVGVTLRSPANMVIVLTLYGVAVLVRQVAEGFRAIPRPCRPRTRAAIPCPGVSFRSSCPWRRPSSSRAHAWLPRRPCPS